VIKPKKVEIRTTPDIVIAREQVRTVARALGFGLADQTRLSTAASELARNIIQYAGSGVCIITPESNEQEMRISVVFEDHGPGISDIEKACEDGFSTGGGLGLGLPGSKRLVPDLTLDSKPGHTKVTIVMKSKRLLGSQGSRK